MVGVLLVPVLFSIRMLFMTVILMAMLIMSVVVVTVMLIVVIMRLMVMIAVVLIPMHMRLEQRTLPERQFRRSIDLKQFGDTGVANQCFDRTVKPWCQIGAHPEDKVGVLQRGRLGRAQVVLMRGRPGGHDQGWLANGLHHARHQ